MPRLAIPYIRMSTKSQLKGDSLRRQTDEINKYASENDLNVDWSTNYIDIGRSAYKRDNLKKEAGLGRFIGAIEAGIVKAGTILIIESLDRLSRDEVQRALSMIIDILQKGIDIHTIGAEKAIYTKKSETQDLIIMIIMLSRANNESREKQNRLSKSWENKRKKAVENKTPTTSRVPAWLKVENDKIKFIPERKAILERIIKLKLDGYGFDKITYILNEENIDTWGSGESKGKRWYSSYIKKIIKNEALIGTYYPTANIDGKRQVVEAIEDYYPPVISKDDFERLNIKKNNVGRKSAYFSNLFSDIATCKKCGSSMTMINKGKPPKGGKYLVCTSAKYGKGCDYKTAAYQNFEQNILNHLDSLDIKSIVEPQHNNELKDDISKSEISIAKTKRDIEKLRSSIENYMDSESDEIIPAYLIKKEAELNEKLGKLEALFLDQTIQLSSEDISRNNYDYNYKNIIGENFVIRAKTNHEIKLIVKSMKIEVHGSYNKKVVEVDITFVGGYRTILLIDKNFVNDKMNKVLTIPIYNKMMSRKDMHLRDNMNIFKSENTSFIEFKKMMISNITQ
jgi:DNA invertase Pin-like site-specific DNA recombinase